MTKLAPLVGLLLACGPKSNIDESLAPMAVSTRKLHVSGRALLDEHGREVILRGFNAGGRAKMPPFLPYDADVTDADAYFARIEKLGANLIRLTFTWEGLEPTRGTYSQAYLDQYRGLLDAAHAHGFSVIVDLHQDVFASPWCGDGFPLWAIGNDIPHGPPRYDCGFPAWAFPAMDPTSDVSRAFDRLWNNTDGLQDDFERAWRKIAAEYKDHPAVAGFEVINEPGSGSGSVEVFESQTLPRFFARIGGAIREEAGDVVVFGGGRTGDATGGDNHLTKPDLAGFVFAPHYYDVLASIGLESTDGAEITRRIRNTFAPSVKWGVPVILGEFGSQNTYAFKAEHFDRIYDALDVTRASGAMWETSQTGTYWNTEDFSVLARDGSENSWAGTTVRAYPRAIAGHLERFAWSAEDVTFTLEVSAATEGVSEVSLPLRHLGDAPKFQLTGDARYRFVKDRALLLVAATPGESWSLTVSK